MNYLYYIILQVLFYIIISSSLNLVAGYTGVLSIAHAAFYGVGAYVAALMALKINCPFIVNLICALLLTALLGLFVGIPSLRIKDESFIIATFAFQIITFSVMNNWISLTSGPMGLPGIPYPVIFGWTVHSQNDFLMIAGFFTVAVFLVCRRIVNSPLGRILKSIREDEPFASAAGKSTAFYKVLIFSISAGMASIAGVLYAHYITFIDPTSFTVMESIFIISIVIIGGAGSLWGPVVGSIVLVSLPELLRFVGLPSAVAANIRQILYGSLLVVFMIWRPRGLVGNYSFYRKQGG